MQAEPVSRALHDILQKKFGFKTFRPGQLEAMTVLLQSNRLLCIQPTGHGKSLLYQLPALYLGGITLVISPLLALMRDQINQLKNRFQIPAGAINSDQTEEENFFYKQAALAGDLNILFIAPEQLQNTENVEFFQRLPIQLLVIDEAHCISSWGHDFRPSYRQIIHLVHALLDQNPEIKLLGLTATANSTTENDIKLQMSVGKKIIVHRESMDRPNIRLSVLPTLGIATKLASLKKIIESLQGSGIVYCSTRENTEIVAAYLINQEIKAAAYHAGLAVEKKIYLQEAFLKDDYSVIAATNALGMGIDKSNLRFVIHFDFPGSITAYYQEVGRAGRDGLPAEGILLYDPADQKVQRYFIEAAQPTAKDFEQVRKVLAEIESLPNLATLKRVSGLHPTKLLVVLAELIEQKYIEKRMQYKTPVYQLTDKSTPPDLSRYEKQRKGRYDDLSKMQYFSEQSQQCLMTILRIALGDETVKACGQCSVCKKPTYKVSEDKGSILTISSWLNRRTVPIHLAKTIKGMLPGIAVLDGKNRSNDFALFMKGRKENENTIGIPDALLQLIKDCLNDLTRHYQFSCIIPLPSITWKKREAVITLLANFLRIPVLSNVLHWKESPPFRQGELLNNDQRQHNVKQRMAIQMNQKIPRGTVLLFDDYIGSGATLNEAAKVLRDLGKISNQLIPFTIAAVKWKVGHTGMI